MMAYTQLYPKYIYQKSFYNKAKLFVEYELPKDINDIFKDKPKVTYIYLYSYSSPVLSLKRNLKDDKWNLYVWNGYKLSQTTVRHMLEFIFQYCGYLTEQPEFIKRKSNIQYMRYLQKMRKIEIPYIISY